MKVIWLLVLIVLAEARIGKNGGNDNGNNEVCEGLSKQDCAKNAECKFNMDDMKCVGKNPCAQHGFEKCAEIPACRWDPAVGICVHKKYSLTPTQSPTTSPTVSPTNAPSVSPTNAPSASPTQDPTASPSATPTVSPTNAPSVSPTENPTASPSVSPTVSLKPLVQNTVWGMVDLDDSYQVSFRILPHAIYGGWSSIFHVGPINVVRQPAVWFIPGSTRLHVRVGTVNDFNTGCDGVTDLTIGVVHEVVMVVENNQLDVYVDGALDCSTVFDSPVVTAVREDVVYAADPFYPAAKASFGDLVFTDLAPLKAIDHTQLTPLTKSTAWEIYGAVKLSSNYEISFDILPTGIEYGGFGHILRVGAQNYPRTPSIWFRPNTLQLHARIATTTNNNDGCDTTQSLVIGTTHKVRFLVMNQVLSVFIDGFLACSQILSSPVALTGFYEPVYVTDPWYAPAKAQIANIEITE